MPGFNSTWTVNFQMFKLDLEKAEEPEIKLPTSIGSLKKQESSRKKKILLLYWLCRSLWVCGSQKVWKILQDMWIPDHLTCLLRNLYACQDITVRTRHGTTDWFQIGKGVHQGLYRYPAYLTTLKSESESEVAQSCPTLCDPIDCSLP